MIMCDALWHLPQVFESYDCRYKFDSVLHTENGDVLYGFSAIYVEFLCDFNLIEIREIHSPDREIGEFD